MQPIATQPGHGDILGFVLASDQLGLCDEILCDRERCIWVWCPWLGPLLVRDDGLGEEPCKTTGGRAEVDSGGPGGVEIVELRGYVGLEQGRGCQKVWAGRRLYGCREGRRDRKRCERSDGGRTADLCT